jgi:hypothetical protein
MRGLDVLVNGGMRRKAGRIDRPRAVRENVAVEDASGLGRGFRDADSSPYLFRYRGAPQSLHASYTYSF